MNHTTNMTFIRDGATVGRGGGNGPPPPQFFFFNASIYNVLSLAIYFNKFAFCLLNNITYLFKSYKKFIDKLKNIILRANLSQTTSKTNPLKAAKKKKKKKLKPILTTRRTPTHT